MTFQEARSVMLSRLESAVAVLRQTASDPEWCNDNYKPYRESVERIGIICRSIMRLNETELEAKR